MNLEDFFCSKTLMRILKLLFTLGQLNISDITQRLGTNYATAMCNLTLLEQEGIITQRLSGRTRFFQFTNTLKAKAIMQLVGKWEN